MEGGVTVEIAYMNMKIDRHFTSAQGRNMKV
jgi:hypothetical protein